MRRRLSPKDSPVGIHKYKEKEAAIPSEPGKPHKDRNHAESLVCFIRRAAGKRRIRAIGGLAAHSSIAFAVRGVVSLQNMTRQKQPDRNHPRPSESQPHVFITRTGKLGGGSQTHGPAEAGIQKRYTLIDAERLEIAQVLTAEAGRTPSLERSQYAYSPDLRGRGDPTGGARAYAPVKRRPEPTQKPKPCGTDNVPVQCSIPFFSFVLVNNNSSNQRFFGFRSLLNPLAISRLRLFTFLF